MVTKEKKHEIVAELTEKLEKASGYFLIDFAGISAQEAVTIRREFHDASAEFKVAKNTLIRRVLKDNDEFENIPSDVFVGSTAIAFGYDTPIAAAKVIKKFFDKDKKLKLKAAIIEGQVYEGSRLKEVSELPSREDMIAGIVGSIHAPISGIVGSVNAVMRDVASLIEEVAKKQVA